MAMIVDTQVLGELVDCADVAVRAAAQLHLVKRGRPLRDKEVLKDAAEFLAAAEAGGVFMSSGDSRNLQATLRPLNWAADARIAREPQEGGAHPEDIDYAVLAQFLKQMQSTIIMVLEGKRPADELWQDCIDFLDCLGETLGTRADQHMRAASLPSSSITTFSDKWTNLF